MPYAVFHLGFFTNFLVYDVNCCGFWLYFCPINPRGSCIGDTSHARTSRKLPNRKSHPQDFVLFSLTLSWLPSLPLIFQSRKDVLVFPSPPSDLVRFSDSRWCFVARSIGRTLTKYPKWFAKQPRKTVQKSLPTSYSSYGGKFQHMRSWIVMGASGTVKDGEERS